MRATAAALASAALVLPGAATQCASPSKSLTNCGAASDHLQNVCIQLSPDPIEKGKPFTLTLSGDLDADLDGGHFNADLDVKALDGIIDEKITKAAPFTISPAAKKGNQQIVIGPVSLPTDIPASGHVAGKVSITNSKGEPVTCVSLNLEVPGAYSSMETTLQALNETAFVASADGPKVSDCSQPSDHMKHFSSSTSGGVWQGTGTFDEDITKVDLDVDVKLHKLFVNIPLKLTIPVSYSPGIPKGDFKVTTGPEDAELSSGRAFAAIDISGTVKANDGTGQEIACAKIENSKEVAEIQEKIVV